MPVITLKGDLKWEFDELKQLLLMIYSFPASVYVSLLFPGDLPCMVSPVSIVLMGMALVIGRDKLNDFVDRYGQFLFHYFLLKFSLLIVFLTTVAGMLAGDYYDIPAGPEDILWMVGGTGLCLNLLYNNKKRSRVYLVIYLAKVSVIIVLLGLIYFLLAVEKHGWT